MTAKQRGYVGDLYWHVHHESLAEFLTEPIAKRIAYIKRDKPKREVPIRLRWMTPVLGEVPAPLNKAQTASYKAQTAYDKARAASDEARAASDTVLQKHLPALEALHAQEHPGCPWRDGTLFPVKP